MVVRFKGSVRDKTTRRRKKKKKKKDKKKEEDKEEEEEEENKDKKTMPAFILVEEVKSLNRHLLWCSMSERHSVK